MNRRLQTLMMLVLTLGGGAGWCGTVTPPPGPVAGSTITVQFVDPASSGWIAPATVPLTITAYSTEAGVTIQDVSIYVTSTEAGNRLGQAQARPDTNAFDYTWAAVAAGNYNVYAVATDSNGKINTSSPLTVTVKGPPDLLITGITPTPVTPVAAVAFTVQVTVKNQGSDSEGGTLTLAPFAGASGADLLVQALPVIAGGNAVTLTFAVPARPDGANVMTATVAGVPNEAATGNNAQSMPYTVVTPLPTDLTVSAIKITPTKPLDATVFLAEVTVKNVGKNANVGGTLTLTPAIGVAGIGQTVPVLAKSKSVKLVFTVPGQTPGTKKMTATLSAVPAETKLTNNSKALNYTVTARPDFTITAVVFSPVAPLCNSTFTAYVTILNHGGAAKAGYLDVWINYADGQAATKSVAVSTISAGKTKRVTMTRLPAGAAVGERTFRAVVDARGTATESDEGNNVFTTTYTPCAITPPSPP